MIWHGLTVPKIPVVVISQSPRRHVRRQSTESRHRGLAYSKAVVLYVACLYALLRMLLVPRSEKAAAAAAFLASWTTILLLPNPLLPATVARSHFWETLGFSLTFGVLLGWLLGKPGPSVARVDKKSREISRAMV